MSCDSFFKNTLTLLGVVLPLITNVLVTTLIVGWIAHAAKMSSRSTSDQFIHRSIATFFESGIMYLAAQLVFVGASARLDVDTMIISSNVAIQIYVSGFIFCRSCPLEENSSVFVVQGISSTFITAGVAINAFVYKASSPTLCLSEFDMARGGTVPFNQSKSVLPMRFAAHVDEASRISSDSPLERDEKATAEDLV